MSEEKKTTPEKETQDDSTTEQKMPEKKVVPKEEPSSDDAKQTSDSEVAWEKLSGTTQSRVRELVNRAKTAEEKATGPLTNTNIADDTSKEETPSQTEVKEAIDKLRGYGVVTTDDLDALKGRFFLDGEHRRLEGKYDGSDGLPKYDSVVAEDYARTHNFGGNLEAAHREMFHDEILDAEVKNRKPARDTYTEKPTASVRVGEKPLTVDSLRERLRQPDGVTWWQKNKEKIEPLLEKLSQR